MCVKRRQTAPVRLTFKASCTSERLSSSGGWCGHFIQTTKGPPFFFWTSLKRVSKTRLALKVCVNRGCVILKCIWIATTLPLLLGGYTWSCRVILVTHRASRVMFTQNWECIQRAASGRCYSSGATRISWKVSGFLLITDNSFTPVPLSIIICTHTSLAREAAAYRRE